MLLLAAGYLVYREPCSGLFPCHDTPDTVSFEERELMRLAKDAFRSDRSLPPRYRGTVRLPEPLQVRIEQSNATLTTAGPIYAGSLQYASAWYNVYHRFHRGTGSVRMRVMWNSGSLVQTFPLSEF